MGHWWSRVRRVHQVAFARGPVDAAAPAPRRYRRDGWPLCPQCGEDELMSTAPIAISRHPQPTDPMRCLACGWQGVVLLERG